MKVYVTLPLTKAALRELAVAVLLYNWKVVGIEWEPTLRSIKVRAA
ncbi:MAG: hypothetical protein OHK0046_47790 [Anaerolineae bacterium]